MLLMYELLIGTFSALPVRAHVGQGVTVIGNRSPTGGFLIKEQLKRNK